MSFGVRENEIQIWIPPIRSPMTWVNYLTSLSLGFLIQEMEVIGKPYVKYPSNRHYRRWDQTLEFQCVFPLRDDSSKT